MQHNLALTQVCETKGWSSRHFKSVYPVRQILGLISGGFEYQIILGWARAHQ